MSTPKRYTITAALPYTNGPIHIGHLAGVYVPADIYARYLRLKGKDVAFISFIIKKRFHLFLILNILKNQLHLQNRLKIYSTTIIIVIFL